MRDKFASVMKEHQFQLTDLSNNKKTAELGKALNTDWIVRVSVRNLETRIVVTATLIDIQTLEVMGGSTVIMDGIGASYALMPGFVADIMQTIAGGSAAPSRITNSPGTSRPTEMRVRSTLFDVTSQSDGSTAEMLLRELELRFEEYNRLFRFNKSQLAGVPLKVRDFSDKAAYDRYVSAKSGGIWNGAIYLHHNQADKRELIINLGSPDIEQFLPLQSFVQFLKSFIPNPPSWMLLGFEIYFNKLTFNKSIGLIIYKQIFAEFEPAKTLARTHREPSLQSVFLADINGEPENFLPVSCALVSFFLNAGGNGDYFQAFIESFLQLKSDGSAAQNAQAVFNRITGWTNLQKMHDDYTAYILSR
jgi:hypothetical protein